MDQGLLADVAAVRDISGIASILRVVCKTTGMGFAAVARVTDEKWLACEVLDEVGFGLKSGEELPLKTTLCDEVRSIQREIVIDHVTKDPVYAEHHTPRMYGLQSYISVPIILGDGSFFGTLCAIHAEPTPLTDTSAIEMFRLFADLIGRHLDDRRRTIASEAALAEAEASAELREQFIAVLGHDLRNPIAAVQAAARLLARDPEPEKARMVVEALAQTSVRMSNLVENLLDLARGRLGGGISIGSREIRPIEETLDQIVDEIKTAHPQRCFEVDYDLDQAVPADHIRLGQLFSNLLGNAVTHGSKEHPITVRARIADDQLHLSVANHGEPIPPEAFEQLFQPFYRGDGTRASGLGIGLYIAAQIASAHGGRLDVASDTEQTCFTFTMPVAGR